MPGQAEITNIDKANVSVNRRRDVIYGRIVIKYRPKKKMTHTESGSQ